MGVLPASAGMILPIRGQGRGLQGAPRIRGDDPAPTQEDDVLI